VEAETVRRLLLVAVPILLSLIACGGSPKASNIVAIDVVFRSDQSADQSSQQNSIDSFSKNAAQLRLLRRVANAEGFMSDGRFLFLLKKGSAQSDLDHFAAALRALPGVQAVDQLTVDPCSTSPKFCGVLRRAG
jgi:hypothetical protein